MRRLRLRLLRGGGDVLTRAELLAQLRATRDADQKAREAKALGRKA